MKKFKKGIFSFTFALVFLPPKKEMEDWGGSFSSKVLARDSLVEKAAEHKPKEEKLVPSKNNATPFKYNGGNAGVDKVSFVLKSSQNPEWEVLLPPIEFTRIWDSGTWSGMALSSNEIHHFYARDLKRGPEPKYRVYSLGSEWQTLDLAGCSKNDLLILQKNNLKKQKYRLTRIHMLNSQELKRESATELEADVGQEYLKLNINLGKNDACTALELEGWPKSFRVKL